VRESVAADALIARLESENAYLRQTLDAEIEPRRRADHLVAGLMERLPELMAGGTAPHDADTAPHRDDAPQKVDVSLNEARIVPKPASDGPASGWRRWWRRITEGH